MVGIAVLVVWLKTSLGNREARRAFVKFVLVTAGAPLLWLAYNAVVYRNPLEFANGPYSARAIEQAVPGAPAHPGAGNLRVAASYFLKAAELNMVESNWHKFWLALPLLPEQERYYLVRRRLWPLLLLWAPLPFYMLSIAYSGVPIFLPPWWPFSLYNVRYGIQLLPAIRRLRRADSVFISWLPWYGDSLVAKIAQWRSSVIVFAGVCYASVWRSQPVSFREAYVNSRTRIPLEKELANTLQELPSNSNLLMFLGDHVGRACQRAGIPLRRVINEGNHTAPGSDFNRLTTRKVCGRRALADPEQ